MNVTREVINDLWPVYAAGEASTDTRALVEAFLQQDPEFARLVQGRGEEALLRQIPAGLPPDSEAQALRQLGRTSEAANVEARAQSLQGAPPQLPRRRPRAPTCSRSPCRRASTMPPRTSCPG